MKMSLKGLQRSSGPDEECAFYPRDQKKNEQITAKTHQIMNRTPLLR